jgi:hypothetical protein
MLHRYVRSVILGMACLILGWQVHCPFLPNMCRQVSRLTCSLVTVCLLGGGGVACACL